MIDTCKFYFLMTSRVQNTLQKLKKSNNAIIIYRDSYFFIKHPYGFTNIKVYFNHARKLLWLETSLPKALQGHNVFGTNNVESLCIAVIRLIYANLELKLPFSEEQDIRNHGILLGRLDITCSYKVKSPHEVDQALNCIHEHFLAEGKTWSTYGKEVIEAVYNQQRSSRICDKFYNKGRELSASRKGLPHDIPGRQLIVDLAQRLIRFEVTYRGRELADLGLGYAHNWGNKRVKEELSLRLQQFNFQGELLSSLAVEKHHDLNASCSMFYDLWSKGVHLAKYRANPTIMRARKVLLERHSVDIFQKANTGCTVSLREVLDPSRAYYYAPKKLVEIGAIFTGHAGLRMGAVFQVRR